MNNKIFDTEMKIDYNNVDGLNRYPSDLQTEYIQSTEEGLDIEKHKPLFDAVSAMKNGEEKTRMPSSVPP